MNHFFRYLVRFKSSTLLNLFGLSLAFAAFLVITMQVRHELTYDKGYATADRLYQLNPIAQPGGKLNTMAPSLLVDELASRVPAIETITYRNGWDGDMEVFPLGRTYRDGAVTVPLFTAEAHFPTVFGLEAISGDFTAFDHLKTALIPESIARKLFPGKNPIGDRIVRVSPYGSDTVEIVAVYRDLPVNASIPNALICYDNNDKSNWRAWNSKIYLTIPDPEQVPQVAQMASELLREKAEWFYADSPKEFCGARLTPLPELYFSPDSPSASKGNRTTLYSLIAIALLIVGVAMVNFINFSLALVPSRIRHINTQKILGSSRWALCRQQLGEMLGLSLIAVLLALWLVSFLSGTSFASLIAVDMRLPVNGSLIALLFGIAVITSLLAGLYPALYSTSFPPALVLKGSFGLSLQGRRLRTGLIGFQYVVSLVLTAMALFIQVQYRYMRNHEVGFRQDQLLTTCLTLSMDRQKDALTNELKNIPGVIDVAYAIHPLHEISSSVITPYHGHNFQYNRLNVTPNFLSVMGIPVVEGRNFTLADEKGKGCYIFNQETQRQLGESLTGEYMSEVPIIGIAADFNYQSLHHPVTPIALYTGNAYWVPMLFSYIRISGDNYTETFRAIQKVLEAFDPDQGTLASNNLEPLDQSVGRQYAQEDRQAKLMALYSLLAVLISTTGAFGLILLETRYRRKEISLRKIFGATSASLLWKFNQRYCRIVACCFIIAAPITYYAAFHWQAHFAYKAPIPLWIFIVAAGIVWIITALTVTLQSHRATHENPVHSLTE